jgi:hypothetical protein
MSRCTFDPQTRACTVCGYVAKRLPLHRRCHPPIPPPSWQPVDIGALVERWLVAIGITKDRVERWTRTAGRPGGCGCSARKRWLTEYGNKVQRRIRRYGMTARRFCYGY